MEEKTEKKTGYHLNTKLWSLLPEKLGIDRMLFYKATGTSSVPFYNVVKHDTVRMSYLCDVCNMFRISMRLFIIEDGEPEVPDEITIPEKDWTPVSLHFDQLHFVYRYKCNGCTRDDFFRVIGYTDGQYGRYVRNAKVSTLQSCDLLRVCNTFGYSPWKVIWDDNYSPTAHELASMNHALELRIRDLEKAVAELQKARRNRRYNSEEENLMVAEK